MTGRILAQTGRRIALACVPLAGLGVIAYVMTPWPIWGRVLLVVGVVGFAAGLIIPAVLEHAEIQGAAPDLVDDAPKPAVVDRTPRNGDDVGRDVTK